MRRKRLRVVVCLSLFLLSAPVLAHTLWVNLYECRAHKPGHIMVSLGFGHAIPMDDLLASKSATLRMDCYELIDPNLQKTALPLPVVKNNGQRQTDFGMTVESGDLGIRKISLTDRAKPGTYQVVAASKASFFTVYINKEGKQKWAQKPMNEVKDARKILTGMQYKSHAKAFFAVGKWTAPKLVGHDLEITPLTNLSKLRVGDLVRLRVTFKGKALSTEMENLEHLTATSNAFGGPDGFFLAAYLHNGEAQFRMPAAGQWMINFYHKQNVTPDGELKELAGKCKMVYYASSVSFNVNP